jgi:hypothetical protein
MGTKICKHCNIEKDISEYYKAGKGKWFQPYCKPCDTIRKRNYAEKNQSRVKEYHLTYYENNKGIIREREKNKRTKYRIENPIHHKPKKELDNEKKRDYMRNWRLANKDKLKKYSEIHFTYEKRKEYKKKYQREQMNKPEYVLLKRLRGRIYMALKRGVKSETTISLLGCSIDFFKEYIAKMFMDGMSWDNMGDWHLDHKKPCVLFNLTNDDEQKKCFHYTNIQPLWSNDNLKKGIKYE